MTALTLPGFNSTLVRLRPHGISGLTASDATFQFHIGSIKTHRSARYTLRLRGFNSTLVRLRLARRDDCRAHQRRFNSTLVRLRPVRLKNHEAQQLSFNSTLVRLRPKYMRPRPSGLMEFQFHIGSIKTRDERGLCLEFGFNLVSIPHWFD